MSKEYLEAFKIVYNNFDYLISDVVIENDDVNICLKTIKEQLPTIKQALHRLESIDNANPSEALEEIKTLRGFNQVELNNDENVNKSLDTINQALLKEQEEHRALEIIKEKNVNIGVFYHVVFILKASYDGCKASNKTVLYNICDVKKEFLTEEEFDLLKEVLE